MPPPPPPFPAVALVVDAVRASVASLVLEDFVVVEGHPARPGVELQTEEGGAVCVPNCATADVLNRTHTNTTDLNMFEARINSERE